MATTSDTLEIIIRLKDTASRGLKSIGQGLGALRGRVSNLLGSLTSMKAMIAGGVAGIGAGLLARSFVSAADTAEQYRTRLNILLGSQEEGNRLFKEMSDFAGTVSFSYEEIMGSATNLAGVMEGGVDEINKWMPMIADLAAASGLSIQDTTNQIIRMYSAGAGAADLFREKGTLAMLGFKAGVSVTAEETRKQLIKAFEDPQSKFKGAATALAKTWTGMLSMMGDRWFQFRNLVMEEGGVFDYMKLLLQELLGFGDKLSKEGKLKKWAISFGNVIVNVLETIIKLVAWLADAWRGWKMIWNSLKAGFAVLGRAFMWVMRGLITMIQAIYDGYAKILELQAKLGEAIRDMGTKMVEAAAKIPESLGGTKVAQIGEGIKAFGQAFAKDTYVAIGNVKQAVDQLEDAKKETREVDKWLDDILDKSIAELDALAAQVPYHELARRKLEEIRAAWVKIQEAREKAAKEPPKKGTGRKPKEKEMDPGLRLALSDEEVQKALAANKTALALLESQWANHEITMEEYFKRREALLYKEFELQRAQLKMELALEPKPEKQAAIRAKLAMLNETYTQTVIKLADDRIQAIKSEEEAQKRATDIVQNIKNRVAQTAAGDSLAAQQKLQTDMLLQQQQEEIDQLLAMKKAGYEVEKQLTDAKNQHILEQEALAAKQKKEIWNTYISSIGSVLGDMTDMFLEWYKASGEKNKELFNVFKAASIARALIATYESATKAYNAMVEVPLIGPALATTAAAVAVAAGLAKVQLIRQQQMASGGMVAGVSPHPKADNIPIKATAGEFMQPVKTVKYYGRSGMEAIRRMLIPPEVIQAFAKPGLAIPRGARLAVGGIATAGSGTSGGAEGPSLSMTTNVMLPETLSFIGRRLESEIEPVVVRVLQEELKY